MGMSKIDRIQDAYTRRMYAAIDAIALDLHRDGRHDGANTVMSIREKLRFELSRMGVYERLELADIIRGHRRAWPEVEA